MRYGWSDLLILGEVVLLDTVFDIYTIYTIFWFVCRIALHRIDT